MTVITFRDVTQPQSGAGNNVTVNVPAAVVNGDLMLAFCEADNTSAAAFTSSGWTQLFTVAHTVDTGQTTLLYRVASSEPANYAFTSTNAIGVEVSIIAYSNVDTSGTIFDNWSSGNGVYASVTASSNTFTVTAPSVTTVTNNGMLLWFGSSDSTNTNAITNINAPAGYTGRINGTQDSSGWNAIRGAELALGTAGTQASAAATWTQTVSGSVGSTGIHVALIALIDTTPDQFTFNDQVEVALSTAITSNTLTLTGTNTAAAISISGGTYQINGGSFTSSSGSINPGDTFAVKVTSSGSNNTSASCTLTIDVVTSTFTVTTRAVTGPTVLAVDGFSSPFGFGAFGAQYVLAKISSGAYTLTAQAGSYSITGQSATLIKTKLITASNGTYAYTGQSATLVKGRVLTASNGTYTYTGQSVTITKSKLLTVSAGSYAYTGQSASLLKTKLLTASAGSYAINGQDATITYTPNAGAYVLTALSGSYSISGQSATLLKSYELTAQSGTYGYTGQDAVITYATLPSGSGSNPGGGGGGGSNPGLGLSGTGSKYYPDLDVKKKSIPDSPIEPEPVIIAKTVTAVTAKQINLLVDVLNEDDDDDEAIMILLS